jgi:glyoxylate/hydroxypyruvate reductase A
VEEDLLAALESGHIDSASLDVFHDEPLPAGHPFWQHPRVVVTPHVASITVPETAIESLAANVERMEAGLPLENVVDFKRGY